MIRVLFVCAMLLALPGAPVLAQTSGASRQGPTTLAAPGGQPRRFPSIFGTASAFPSPGGTGFVGLNYVNPRGGIEGEGADGDAALGYTIGSPVDAVSVTLGATVTSLQGFGDSGGLNISAARALRVGERSLTFAGAQASNLAAWGDAAATPEAYSIYVSHLAAIPARGGEVPVQLTLGYGNRIVLDGDGTGEIGDGLFAGIGVGLGRNLSASLSATRTQLNAGIGFNLPDLPAVSVALGVFDVTNTTERRQVSLGVSLGF